MFLADWFETGRVRNIVLDLYSESVFINVEFSLTFWNFLKDSSTLFIS